MNAHSVRHLLNRSDASTAYYIYFGVFMASGTPLADRLDTPIKIQNKNIIDLVVISTWRRVSFTNFGTEINGGEGLERRLCVVGE